MNDWQRAPAAFLAAYPASRALDPEAQQELLEALQPVELHAGETLFSPGDPRDATYFILCGLVSLTAQGPAGQTLPPQTLPRQVLGAGQVVGEIGLSAEGPHTSTARTLDDTLLLRLTKSAFEALWEKYPEAISRLSLAIAPAAAKTLLARVLCDLLGELDARLLATLLEEMECLELTRGEVLSRQGQDEDRMFIVVYGRLRVVCRDADGTETVLAEAGRGDTVGEGSLLTGEAPPGTVSALPRQCGRGHHPPALRDAAVPVPGRGGAPEPHSLAPGPARARPERGRGCRGAPAGCRQRSRGPGRHGRGRPAAYGFCGAAGGGALRARRDLAPERRAPGRASRRAGDCPDRPRGPLGAGADRLVAAAGAKLRLRGLRGGLRLDALDRTLRADGRPGDHGRCGGRCPRAHRTGRTPRAARRLHQGRTGAAPARRHRAAVWDGRLAGPPPRRGPRPRAAGPAGGFR